MSASRIHGSIGVNRNRHPHASTKDLHQSLSKVGHKLPPSAAQWLNPNRLHGNSIQHYRLERYPILRGHKGA